MWCQCRRLVFSPGACARSEHPCLGGNVDSNERHGQVARNTLIASVVIESVIWYRWYRSRARGLVLISAQSSCRSPNGNSVILQFRPSRQRCREADRQTSSYAATYTMYVSCG